MLFRSVAATGATGVTGSTGPTGPTGPSGSRGVDATCPVGTINCGVYGGGTDSTYYYICAQDPGGCSYGFGCP